MANSTYTSHVDNYNYSKENVNIVTLRERNAFDLAASAQNKSYVRVVINTSRTDYNNIINTRVVARAKTVKPKKLTIDDARLVILGGPFQEIGGSDEAVGGGNQKVGSKNK